MESGHTTIADLVGGHHGARTVLAMVAAQPDAQTLLDQMGAMNLRGAAIWYGYSDFARSNLGSFLYALRQRDPDLADSVNQSLARHGVAVSRDPGVRVRSAGSRDVIL